MLKPIRDAIIFAFVDDVGGKHQMFIERSASGLYLGQSHMESATRARWVKVVAKGPEVRDDIRIGSTALIEPLQWTHGFKFDGVQLWKTDATKVLALLDE